MNQEPEWTPEEEDAFNQVEQQSNLGKQILRDMKKQEPMAWMYPDDLKRFETSETFAQAYSIQVVSPTHGETIPLYLHPSEAFEQGIQEGMKRERALWLMQAEGQKIEQTETELGWYTAFEANRKPKIEQPRPLTDEQLDDLLLVNMPIKDHRHFARAIEAAHGIKE
jgi:hypothetical protein